MKSFAESVSPELRDELRAWIPVVALLALVTGQALAGSDTTFDAGTSQLSGWLTGSLGKLAATGALAVGVTTAMVTHKLQSAAVAGGIALVAAIGPAVVGNMFSLGL